MSTSHTHFAVTMPWCSHAHAASHILGLLQNTHANGMMGVCCCRGMLKEHPRREVGDTADEVKRVLQKEGLKKGRVQKLQESGKQGAPMQVCTHPARIPGFAQPHGQTTNKA